MNVEQGRFLDPFQFKEVCWPHVKFYREQMEIIKSVRDNSETYVPAGNMLGKDFVAGFIALWFFCSRHPCRVLTTSVDGTQLEGVLWGEIRRFVQDSKLPLASEEGGPLVINHLHIRKVINGKVDGLSYLMGRVAAKGEGMLGHHIADTGDGVPRTLFIADEASGVDDVSYERADTWASRKLVIGNPYPCTNFFYRGVKAGDLKAGTNGHYIRKVIKIRGDDSPNVRIGRLQEKLGETVRLVVEGVLPYDKYKERRLAWDRVRQCIGLDAEFYEGAETLMFPPDWLNLAEQAAIGMDRYSTHTGCVMGVDCAMGGDNTSWAIVNRRGLLRLKSVKTPDTTVIPDITLALMREYNVPPEKVLMDAGGGGYQHADVLRKRGYSVQAIKFGEAASPERRRAMTTFTQKKLDDDIKYIYKNRRAEMYGSLRLLLEPRPDKEVFGLPSDIINSPRGDGGPSLRRQMAVVPMLYDEEGRIYMLPKSKKMDSDKPCLIDIIGCSPDEMDALVLAVYGLTFRKYQPRAGVA